MIEIRDNQYQLQRIVDALNKIRDAEKELTEAVNEIDPKQIKGEVWLHFVGIMLLSEKIGKLLKCYGSDMFEMENSQREVEVVA